MKVINLLGDCFQNSCVQLKENVWSEYKPDLVVGIATGGEVVVQNMLLDETIHTLILKRQRPFTKTKKRLKFDKWLPYLPFYINDVLRKTEVFFNEIRYELSDKFLLDDSDVLVIKKNCNELNKYRKILIVDDSIDSGKTIKKVISFIKNNVGEKTEIRVCAINTTFKKPMITPDYTLYIRTIVRFPWAADVREK